MKFIRLGQVLIDEKIITADQLEEALARQKVTKKRLGQVIIDMNFTTERVMLQSLAKRIGTDYVDAPLFDIELDVVNVVPESFARKYTIVPLSLKLGVLTIAMNDPLDFNCLEDLRMITGFEVRAAVSPLKEIEMAINRVYSKRTNDQILGDIQNN